MCEFRLSDSKVRHYSWISSSPIGTVHNCVFPYDAIVSIHSTRDQSVSPFEGLFHSEIIIIKKKDKKQISLSTDDLTVDPTYPQSQQMKLESDIFLCNIAVLL